MSINKILQHLTVIYINPNKVWDIKYEYNHLIMKPCQSFTKFQTQFLHLIGEGQVPLKNYCLNLYNKLTIRLQEKIAVTLDNLPTY